MQGGHVELKLLPRSNDIKEFMNMFKHGLTHKSVISSLLIS